MHLASLLRSTGFRLVAWYAGLFGASVAILLAVVYWIAVAAVEQQLDDSVVRELRLLVDVYNTRGLKALQRGITRRTQELSSPRRYYLLQDAQGQVIGGNLAALPPMAGKRTMSVPVPEAARKAAEEDDQPDTMLAEGRRLSQGEYLLVGENQYRLVRAKEAIVSAVGWGTAFTVLLALGGGVLLAIGYLRRIEEVNRAIRSIMDGALSQRVPTRGSGDEMDQLAANLNAMLDRIQMLMESLKRVSDDIAHDLRTPLSRLRQRLEMARSQISAVPGEHVQVIEQAVSEVDAILETFTALLRIAQIEAGTRRAAFSRLSLERLLGTVAEIYAPVAEDHGHRLRAVLDVATEVDGDRELLIQMFANLIENSIQHSAPGTAIVLELTGPAGMPVVRIVDTGPGIPESERAKVFRRFYRLESSRTSRGNGLGLALVKAVADLHGASIELADNHPGLCVTLRFPARPAGGPTEAIAGAGAIAPVS